jgi:hypothetical protein
MISFNYHITRRAKKEEEEEALVIVHLFGFAQYTDFMNELKYFCKHNRFHNTPVTNTVLFRQNIFV